MSITSLTLTVNGTERVYPSYVTLAESEIYLGADPELCGWVDLDEAVQVKRLVAATRRLERLSWGGRQAVPGQALAWPRIGLTYPDGAGIGSTVLPAAVEIAATILAGDTSVDLAASAAGAHSLFPLNRSGAKRESYFYQLFSEVENLLPGGTLDLISYWLGNRRRLAGASITGRANNQPSEFSETYERLVFVNSSSYLERNETDRG